MERRVQVQSYVNQTELTSERNSQCKHFTLVERLFIRRTTELEKIALELIAYLAFGNHKR